MKKIVMRQSSGLGNQMFIYGLGYALAKKYNMYLCQDLSKYFLGITSSHYQLRDYSISYQELIPIPFRRRPRTKYTWKLEKKMIALRNRLFYNHIIEEQFMKYQEITINTKRNNYLRGFWQVASYVEAYREDLKRELSLKEIRENVEAKSKEISESLICGIHIRRGDYLSFFGGSLDMEYYRTAIKRIQEMEPEVFFLVFSDDIDFCKQYFNDMDRVQMIEQEFSAQEEMHLMSRCKYLIIANSSFSWWGAFLSNAQKVICPRTEMWSDEYYLNEWEKMDAKMIPISKEGLRHMVK